MHALAWLVADLLLPPTLLHRPFHALRWRRLQRGLGWAALGTILLTRSVLGLVFVVGWKNAIGPDPGW